MRLFAWRRADREIEFDPQTGSATVLRLSARRPDDKPCPGFAEFERSIAGFKTAFAVYRDGQEIFFSAGGQRWRLGDPEIRLEHDRRIPFVSHFRVLVAGRSVFSFRYRHLGRLLFALIDPTYDKLDQDSDFFLEFLAEQARSADWVENVRARWVSVS